MSIKHQRWVPDLIARISSIDPASCDLAYVGMPVSVVFSDPFNAQLGHLHDLKDGPALPMFQMLHATLVQALNSLTFGYATSLQPLLQGRGLITGGAARPNVIEASFCSGMCQSCQNGLQLHT